jgi:uncharacterized membrane protein YebE (DUF533 family)
MTPEEKVIVRALIAVAWADGDMQAPEAGVVEGLLAGFDASPADEAELLEYAKTPRTLRDLALATLSPDAKDTLLRNAALLVCADGVETQEEKNLLAHLAEVLDVQAHDAQEIVHSVRVEMGARSRAGH